VWLWLCSYCLRSHYIFAAAVDRSSLDTQGDTYTGRGGGNVACLVGDAVVEGVDPTVAAAKAFDTYLDCVVVDDDDVFRGVAVSSGVKVCQLFFGIVELATQSGNPLFCCLCPVAKDSDFVLGLVVGSNQLLKLLP